MRLPATIFLILLAGIAMPRADSRAQPSPAAGPSPTIAMITWRGVTDTERGFVDGMIPHQPTVTIEWYHADQDLERLNKIISRIHRQPVDLIYVFGTIATQSVLEEFKKTPVIFNAVNRPVASGIIRGWDSSGNNAVGASNQVPVESQFKALKKVVKFRRLGIIYNPREPNSCIQRDIASRLQQRMGFNLVEYKIVRSSDMAAVMPMLKGAVDAVFIPADSLMNSMGGELARWINDLNLPSLATVETMVADHGLLMGLQPCYYQLGILAADKARRILDGESPADIPSSRLDYFQVTVNMKTARRIGVQIPMSILVIANQIVR